MRFVHLPFLLMLALAAAPLAHGQEDPDGAEIRAFLSHGVFEMGSGAGPAEIVEFHEGALLYDGGTTVDVVDWSVEARRDGSYLVFSPSNAKPFAGRIASFDGEKLTFLLEPEEGVPPAETSLSLILRMEPAQYRAYRREIMGTWKLHEIGQFDVSELEILFAFGSDGTFSFNAEQAQAMGGAVLAQTPLLLTQMIARGSFESQWVPSLGAYPAHAADEDAPARRAISLHSGGRPDGYFVIERIAPGELVLDIGDTANPDLRLHLRRTY